jgi:hypothetical protein
LDVETQKPTDKKQKIKIKGKPIKFSPKCFSFFFFLLNPYGGMMAGYCGPPKRYVG